MGQLGGLTPAGSVAIGVVVGLLSTSIQSVGLTLQRKSHILEEEKEFQDARRPPYRRRRWQLGMLMFLLANIVGSTIQITTLPLPVLASLQASGLVFNSICASLILGEPFTRYSLAGTLLVSGGAILIAIFGAVGEPAHNLDQLLAFLGRRQFVLWMVGQAILVAAIILGAKAIKLLGPYYGNSPRLRLCRGMAYGAISGILSAHSLLLAKTVVELLVRTIIDGRNQFNRLPSWLILLSFLALALSQLYFLHRGLKLCSTSILYPFVFCVYNIIAILDGLIYFHQTSRLSTASAVLIAVGTLVLLSGVVCLSWRLHDDSVDSPTPSKGPLSPGSDYTISAGDASDYESETPFPPYHDEEADASLPPPRRSATLPAIFHHASSTAYGTQPLQDSFQDEALSPTAKTLTKPNSTASSPTAVISNSTPSLLRSAHRSRRARTIAEADEIWGELEEGLGGATRVGATAAATGIRALISPLAPFSAVSMPPIPSSGRSRRRSSRPSSSGQRHTRATGHVDGADDQVSAEHAVDDAADSDLEFGADNGRDSQPTHLGTEATENTHLLVSPRHGSASSRGRLYRARRARPPNLLITTDSSSSPGPTPDPRTHGRAGSSRSGAGARLQEAVGDWLPLQRWWGERRRQRQRNGAESGQESTSQSRSRSRDSSA